MTVDTPPPVTVHPASPPFASRVAVGRLGVILLLGLLLRLWHLGDVTVSFDEACSLRISQFPLPEMFDAIGRDAHPPVFYLLLKGWGLLFGSGVVAVRLLGVAFGVLGIAAGWWLVETVRAEFPKRQRAGELSLWAALAIALDPLHLRLSQEARPYSFGLFLAFMGATCLVRAIRHPECILWWIGSTLLLGLLSLTHYYGLLTCGALVLWGLLEAGLTARNPETRRTGYQIAAGMTLLLAALHLAWFPWFSTFEFQQERACRQLWMPPLDFSHLNRICWSVLTSGQPGESGGQYGYVAVWVWSFAALLLILRGGRSGRLLGMGALIPMLLAVGYSFGVRNILGVRYLLFAQVFLLLGLCWRLATVPRFRWAARAMLGVLILWCGFWSCLVAVDRSARACLPGLAAAVRSAEEQTLDAPIVVSSPFVYTMCVPYRTQPERWHLQYLGDHRDNILSGPALQPVDYAGTTALLVARPEVVVVVDQAGMFQESSRVQLPVGYELTSEAAFIDRMQGPVTFTIRVYHREDKPTGTEGSLPN